MREIKFKAWDNKTKTMTICRSLFDWLDVYAQFEYDTTSNQLNRIKQFTFLQHTGLKDKNDREIYEGDIIKAINRNLDCEENREEYFTNFEVIYLNGCFMFGNWNAHEFFNSFMFREVVGNIYENPELL